MIYKHRGHLWIGKAAKIRCFLSPVSRQQSTCNGFMFVIKNHANKNRLIKNLIIYVPTNLSSLAFSSSPFRSVQSRSWNIPEPFQYRSELFHNRWEFRTDQPLPLGPSTKWNNRSLDMSIRLFPSMYLCFSVPFRSVHNDDTDRQSTSMDWQGSQKYDAICSMFQGSILHAMASI